MTQRNIINLLKHVKTVASEEVESETIEFKAYRDERSLHNSKDLAEEISALANLKGGVIIIGVKDSSDVQSGDWLTQMVGIHPVDETATQERLKGKLQPRINLEVSNLGFEGKNYVVVDVPHRSDSMVSTTSGKTCLREGRSSRPMLPDEIEHAVKSLTSYDWSAEPLDGLPSSVIDTTALKEAREDFCNRRGLATPLKDSAFLEAIGATKNGILTKSGLIFLGREDAIRTHLGDFEYRFSWKTNTGKLLANEVWSDCLWHTIKRAKHHFSNCNIEETFEFDFAENPITVPLLDPIAFHEAFLNSLVHRDYSCEGMVSITFAGMQIVITSPGKFFGGVTADNIARHEPRHRNKALARMLMTYHLVDRAGMGVMRMGLRSLMYGREFPQFREDSESVEVRMQGEYLRGPIAVLAIDNEDKYGITELLILNSIYETGVVAVRPLIEQLMKHVSNPWPSVQNAVNNISGLELCGTKDGVFVRVTREWMKFFRCSTLFRVSATSKKHVALFEFLMRNESVSTSDVHPLFDVAHQSYTSKFLSEARYTKRTGHGPSSRWSLN